MFMSYLSHDDNDLSQEGLSLLHAFVFLSPNKRRRLVLGQGFRRDHGDFGA